MRAAVVLMLSTACLLAAPPGAQAQIYPTGSIRLVVPFAPGGAADIGARLVARRLTGILQQPVDILNRPGGGGTLASEAVSMAAPDGYTLLYATNATLVIAPIFARTPRYDPLASFSPVALVSSIPCAIAVNTSLPASTLEELIALIKAAPGKYRYATFGPGSAAYTTAELFKTQTGLDITEVVGKPPRTPTAMLAAGEADIVFDAGLTIANRLKDGNIRPIAIMGGARFAHLPGVPTTAEMGHKDLVSYIWSGIVAPAGTPPGIITLLNRAVLSVLAELELQATFAKIGMVPEGSTPEEMRELIGLELTRWSRVVPLSATAQ